MTASSFILFIPALVGRLAAGVLTQQQKTGTESEPLLPASWQVSTEAAECCRGGAPDRLLAAHNSVVP
jgi:hypothetical protein